jgi:hypothetical protein
MEQEVATGRSFGTTIVRARGIRRILLALVWAPFLASNYLTITHLISWVSTDHWPTYSTASLLSDMKVAHPVGRPGVQPVVDWIMAAPAAYSLMGLAIVLSIAMALLPDN